jgi:hypothetical protein
MKKRRPTGRVSPDDRGRRPRGPVPPRDRGRTRSGALEDSTIPIDPYLRWAMDTEFKYLPGYPDQPLPVLIKLKDGNTAQTFANKTWGPGNEPPAGLDQWFKIPDMFKSPPAGLESFPYCTAEIRRHFIGRVFHANNAFSKVIEQLELSDPVGRIAAPIQMVTRRSKVGWTPSVIVGIIDDGLPFANVRFRARTRAHRRPRTRVEYFWDQDPLGRAWSKAQIDRFLRQSLHGELVDEDEVYRRAGYHFKYSGHKSWARRATHGAAVMDQACGLDLESVLPNSPCIIGVQLPNAVTADPSGTHLDAFVFSALWYILSRADSVASKYGSGRLPVVVNLSYGRNQGPHDGTSAFEAAIDLMTRQRSAIKPFTVVLPAGNSHLTRGHARFRLYPRVARARTLEWRVLPDDATPSILEIWLPAGARAAQVTLQVVTPDGTTIPAIQAPFFGKPSGAPWLDVAFPGSSVGSGRISIALTLLPTTILHATKPVAPSGTWLITLTNAGPTSLLIDSWIARDDTPFGYPIRGRQSRFEDPLYELHRFDPQGRLSEVDTPSSYVKRDGSINGLATGTTTAVIGGNRHSDFASARYSAGGPTIAPRTVLPPPRRGPDATAAAEFSVASVGMLASGMRSRSVIAVNGTSVAAPQVTRWIASRMARRYSGNRAAVAAQGARIPTPKIPASRGNRGDVDPKYSPIKVDRHAPL